MYAAAYVWAKILNYLERQLTEVMVSAWLDDAEVIELTAEKLILYSPSDFRQEIIQTRCAEYIEAAAKELFDINLKLEVWGEGEMKTHREKKLSAGAPTFHPQFSFESFIEGSSNRFAKQITMMAAKNPGLEMCNPLFLYGVPGVGKTHLLYAAANYIIKENPSLKVVCIKAEAFTNDLLNAIRQGSTAAFRNKYRQADVLLLDDIQFIAGKESTQEEFFHTFNTLYESNRQIILIADRKPSDMATLADRLRDRFGEGVMVEIPPPDSQTRMEIIQSKAEQYGLELSKQIIEYISSIAQNVRQVEGALKKIRAYRDLTGMPLTMDAVSKVVDDLAAPQSARVVTPIMILRNVCRYYGVDEQTLKSPQKSRNIAEPRQVAMYLMRQTAELCYDDIAKHFSRDRATVIHSIKKVEQALGLKDSKMASILQDIQANIEASFF